MSINVKLSVQYANLSRGRITAKHLATGQWGERGNGCVTLDKSGKWQEQYQEMTKNVRR